MWVMRLVRLGSYCSWSPDEVEYSFLGSITGSRWVGVSEARNFSWLHTVQIVHYFYLDSFTESPWAYIPELIDTIWSHVGPMQLLFPAWNSEDIIILKWGSKLWSGGKRGSSYDDGNDHQHHLYMYIICNILIIEKILTSTSPLLAISNLSVKFIDGDFQIRFNNVNGHSKMLLYICQILIRKKE